MSRYGFWPPFLLFLGVAAASLWWIATTWTFDERMGAVTVRYPPLGAERILLLGLGLAGLVFGYGAWRGLFRSSSGSWAAFLLLLAWLAGIEVCMKAYILAHGPMYRPHPSWDHEFQSHEPWEPKRPGEVLIVVLGDSTAHGVGMQPGGTRFSDLLQQALDRPGRRVRVLNVAIPASSVLWMSRFARERIEPLQPDLYVLAFNNDVNASASPDSASTRADGLSRLEGWLFSSDIYLVVRRRLLNALPPPPAPTAAPTTRVTEDEWRTCYGELLRKAAPSLLVLMPREDVLELDGQGLAEARRHVMERWTVEHVNTVERDLAQFHATLRDVASREGGILVDAWSDWKASGRRGPEYFHPDRLHLTSRGHEELSRLLLRALEGHPKLQEQR